MAQPPLVPYLFQTFFVSREKSGSPQIEDMITCGKILQKNVFFKNNQSSLASAHGNRVLLTGEDAVLQRLVPEDIVEIVDYDPIKNVVVASGKTNPCMETPVHWMIQKARHDVHATVFIHTKEMPPQLVTLLPCTLKVYPMGTIESIKEILKTLRDGKTIIVKEKGILFVGVTLQEIQTTATQLAASMTP